eukprot:1832487-Rhodomonas_salina.3
MDRMASRVPAPSILRAAARLRGPTTKGLSGHGPDAEPAAALRPDTHRGRPSRSGPGLGDRHCLTESLRRASARQCSSTAGCPGVTACEAAAGIGTSLRRNGEWCSVTCPLDCPMALEDQSHRPSRQPHCTRSLGWPVGPIRRSDRSTCSTTGWGLRTGRTRAHSTHLSRFPRHKLPATLTACGGWCLQCPPDTRRLCQVQCLSAAGRKAAEVLSPM